MRQSAIPRRARGLPGVHIEFRITTKAPTLRHVAIYFQPLQLSAFGENILDTDQDLSAP